MVAMEHGATGQLGLWSELWDGAGGLTCRLEGLEGPCQAKAFGCQDVL